MIDWDKEEEDKILREVLPVLFTGVPGGFQEILCELHHPRMMGPSLLPHCV